MLSTSLFDGWLALTVPFYAFVGTGLGLAVGLLVRLVIRSIEWSPLIRPARSSLPRDCSSSEVMRIGSCANRTVPPRNRGSCTNSGDNTNRRMLVSPSSERVMRSG